MDPSDFNQTEQWCPRLHGSASDSPCVYPTARDLLNMGSGLLDVDNCNYPPDAWQRKYCIPEEDTVLLIGGSPDQGEIGGHGPAEYFAAQGYWNLPLEHMPGEPGAGCWLALLPPSLHSSWCCCPLRCTAAACPLQIAAAASLRTASVRCPTSACCSSLFPARWWVQVSERRLHAGQLHH